MPTVEERYRAASDYIRRAIATVEAGSTIYMLNPITGAAQWYIGRTKTEEPRGELGHIESRWTQAKTDSERATIARDAELLADRIEENLPGAPQDRPRTNLYAGEIQRGTPATSYAQEVVNQGSDLWGQLRTNVTGAGQGFSTIGKLALLGGGIALAWKTIDFLRERQTAKGVEQALNNSLTRAAESRNAPARSDYYVRSRDTGLYYRVVRDNGGRQVLLVPLTDDARDAIAGQEAYMVTMPDGSEGEAYTDNIAHYERVSKLPRSVLR